MKHALILFAAITLPLAASANDRLASSIASSIDRMEKALVDQSANEWVIRFKDVREELADERFANHPKRAALVERYRAAIAQAAAVIGPRAKLFAGDKEEPEAKEEAVEVLAEAMKLCSSALSPNGGAGNLVELDKRIAEYTKKVERAVRIDARIVATSKGHAGSHFGGPIGNLWGCELGLAFRRSTFEDSPPEPPTLLDGERKTIKGCGFIEYDLRAEKLRGGKTGKWEANGNESYARPLACKDFPRGAKAPSAAVKSALLASFASAKGGVVYEQYFDGDDANVKAVDFEKRVALVERYKVIGVRVYKKDAPMRETPCKELDPKIACMMHGDGSSAVVHYEGAKFRLARAEARKKQNNVAQCKRLLKAALEDGRRFTKSKDDTVRYKTTDGILDGVTLETKLAKIVETAEQRSDTGWCGQ